MAEPLVSVVIPTRDRVALLREAVASVQAQTYRSIELVVVDDQSSDETAAWLAAKGDRIRSIRPETHRERCYARNLGLEAARGEFVLFLDDDDRLVPSAIAGMADALRRHPAAAAAVGAAVSFDGHGNRARVPHPRRTRCLDAWPDVVFGWVTNPSRTLFRVAHLRAIGGWREDVVFAEDRELLLRLTRAAPIALVPGVVAEYRLHSGQVQPTDGLEAVDAIIERHAAVLRADEVRRFETIRHARSLRDSGIRAFDESDYRRAVRDFIAASKVHPSLLVSPLTRRDVLRPLAKAAAYALIGGRSASVIRRAIATGRRLTKRDVWESRAPLGDRSDHPRAETEQ